MGIHVSMLIDNGTMVMKDGNIRRSWVNCTQELSVLFLQVFCKNKITSK